MRVAVAWNELIEIEAPGQYDLGCFRTIKIAELAVQASGTRVSMNENRVLLALLGRPCP
ncbi:hypothetical protein ACVWYQ_003522 [Bradyrhizobium sp. USDA 3397]